MTHEEFEVCDRFKQARLALKMKQGDFAREITTTQGHVSDIENKRKGVSDRLITIICLKWGINEEWVRHGTGDMFVIPEDEDAEIIETLMTEKDDIVYDTILTITKAYKKLSPESKSALQSLIKNILEEQKNREA